MFFVYILKSNSTGQYYIGCTNNLEKRVIQHNSGFSKFTKTRGPWTLVYREEFDNLVGARRREKQIKSWKKRSVIEALVNHAAFV